VTDARPRSSPEPQSPRDRTPQDLVRPATQGEAGRLSSVVAVISRSRARLSAEPPVPIVKPTANAAILKAIPQR